MDNKSYGQLILIQSTIEPQNQDYYEKTKNLTAELTGMIASIMDQIQIYKSSPDTRYSPKSQYPTTLVPSNNRDPPLEGGNSKKIGGM